YAAIHSFGVFAKHHLVDRHIRAGRVCDFVTPIIERIAGITFARPHVGMEMEQLSQSDDRRKIIQSFAFKLRAQFFLCFVLWLTGDGSEQRAGSVLKRLYSAIRK